MRFISQEMQFKQQIVIFLARRVYSSFTVKWLNAIISMACRTWCEPLAFDGRTRAKIWFPPEHRGERVGGGRNKKQIYTSTVNLRLWQRWSITRVNDTAHLARGTFSIIGVNFIINFRNGTTVSGPGPRDHSVEIVPHRRGLPFPPPSSKTDFSIRGRRMSYSRIPDPK